MEDEDDHRPTTAMTAAEAPPLDHHAPHADLAPSPFADERTITDTRLGPGEEVGGYIIEAEIGKGGMGHVYSATHPVIGKRAAIKVLKPEVSKQPIILERFIQEARAVNQIGHPNIIDIFAFGKLPDGRAFHIMDLLEGESLRKRIKRGALHPSEAAAIIGDVASALTAAHEKGFVHRDLKPDNVFLVRRSGDHPEVKLLDFGLAKLMPEMGTSPFTTKTGVMLGTPEYMSPEQARGIGVDYRTDIYALGVLTFELVAGQRPFPSLGDAFATMQAHIDELPPSLREVVPGLPDELVQLVEAMLAKDPAARPSLAAVRNVIKRLRTTQLPSRTEAGLEVNLPPTVAKRASGLAGADAGDEARTIQNMRRPSAPPLADAAPAPTPLKRTMSHPPVDGPRVARQPSQPSGNEPPNPGTGPVPSYQSMHYSNPGSPSQFGSTNSGVGAAGNNRDSNPSVPSYQSMHVYSAPSVQAPGLAGSGLKQPSSPLMGTQLGVQPAKVVTAPQTPAMPSSAIAPAEKPSSNLMLVLGALVAIAIGIGIALLAVGN